MKTFYGAVFVGACAAVVWWCILCNLRNSLTTWLLNSVPLSVVQVRGKPWWLLNKIRAFTMFGAVQSGNRYAWAYFENVSIMVKYFSCSIVNTSMWIIWNGFEGGGTIWNSWRGGARSYFARPHIEHSLINFVTLSFNFGQKYLWDKERCVSFMPRWLVFPVWYLDMMSCCTK